MRHYYHILIGILFLFVCSCQSSPYRPSANYVFTKEISLNAEKIKINEIIHPMGIRKLDDYIIIEGEMGTERDLFYVYSRDKFQYLYSFGTTGRGPNEFLMPTSAQNAPGNNFLVFDNPTNIYYSYNITDSGAFLKNKYPIVRKNEFTPMQAIAYVNDSIILYNTLSKESVRLNTFNVKTSSIIDSLRLVSNFNNRMGQVYNPTMDSYHFDYKDGLIVLACRHIDEMVFTSLDSNYYFVNNNIQLKNADFTPDKDIMNNINHYVFTCISNDYIFTQRYGRYMSELQPLNLNRNFRFNMEVLSKKNEPVAILHFDNNMLKFIVDEKNNCLYSWDPLDNFDFIHKYNLNSLLEVK